MLAGEVAPVVRALIGPGGGEPAAAVTAGLLAGGLDEWPPALLRLAVEVLWHDGVLDTKARDDLADLLDGVVAAAAARPLGVGRLVADELRRRAAALVDRHEALRLERLLASTSDAPTTVRLVVARVAGHRKAHAALLASVDLAALSRPDRAVALREAAVRAAGIDDLASLRLPGNEEDRAALVARLGPVRPLLEQAVETDAGEVWSRLLLGALLHCEGATAAASHLDLAAAGLAAHGVAPSLVADLHFHAGLARLRRSEGAGEADGNGRGDTPRR